MQIFSKIKTLVKKEKQYTAAVLKLLMIVEKEKLYCDLKYSSLHKYIIKELKYSDKEATIRVNAVRLMLKSKNACVQIDRGSMTLTNAAEANKVLQQLPKEQHQKTLIDKIVHEAATQSTRGFKNYVDAVFERERREVLVLKEYMIEKFDRLRRKYGDLSTLELIEILMERELKAPTAAAAKRRPRGHTIKNSRFIPKSVKLAVYESACVNCGVMFNLEYDHKVKFSHGGSNKKDNIQVLCKACNLRKEIKIKQTGLFV